MSRPRWVYVYLAMSIGGQSGRTCALAVVLCTWLFAGCSLNPFFLGESANGDGGTGDGGGGEIDGGGGGIDGGTPDADNSDVDAGCVQTAVNEMAAAVSCDEIDNDCDGMTDEDTNLQTDRANCGACGIRCALIGASGECTAGDCGNFACTPGHLDIDLDLNTVGSNGCEYACLPTNLGLETCDFTDNDCDGDVDEGFGGDTDVNNCGGCGIQCNILNAVEECVAGQCGFTDCDTGFADVFNAANPPNVPGCEYQCPVFPVQTELCNNIDDDCDGVIDESPSGGTLGNNCTTPGFETEADVGACEFGTVICSAGGGEVCGGYTGPRAETCNNIDDDCDGTIDDGFDTQNNPNSCGASCEVCSFDNSFATCVAGVCTFDPGQCVQGFVDLDGNAGNGCEYPCTITNGGDEVCDGRDNDCDGLTDDADNGAPGPGGFGAADQMDGPPAGLICNPRGACAGTTPICSATPCQPASTTWRCDYPAASEDDNCFVLPIQETLCDNIDGDCDGAVDEAFPEVFPTRTQACADSGTGACQGTGTFRCTADSLATECNITTAGATAVAESCNGIDDDCDDATDEYDPAAVPAMAFIDSMVGIDMNGDSNIEFYIDAYEASRPDATAVSPGVNPDRACSNAGVEPWGNLTWLEADAACAAAGKRLCTESEWEDSCAGTGASVYPYGDVYDPNACNGNDFDPNRDPGDTSCSDTDTTDELQITGFAEYGCLTPLASCEQTEWNAVTGNTTGTFDMVGNVKEWTSDSPGAGTRRIRGGAYDSAAQGMTCQFDFVSASEDFHFPNLGFRCCVTLP